MNHRTLPRLRRRLKLQLGALQTFTADISPTGFAAELMQALRPGTDLNGSIELCGETFVFTGKVCWAKAGEPRMNVRGRFGVRFTGMPNGFFEMLKSAYAPMPSPAPA